MKKMKKNIYDMFLKAPFVLSMLLMPYLFFDVFSTCSLTVELKFCQIFLKSMVRFFFNIILWKYHTPEKLDLYF